VVSSQQPLVATVVDDATAPQALAPPQGNQHDHGNDPNVQPGDSSAWQSMPSSSPAPTDSGHGHDNHGWSDSQGHGKHHGD
jgi:hypothetical protein